MTESSVTSSSKEIFTKLHEGRTVTSSRTDTTRVSDEENKTETDEDKEIVIESNDERNEL